MTIASDILARTPILYWKLDDASGPAASDYSGNGRPGAYGGAFTLGQFGPEAGTLAAQFATGGVVSRVGVVQPASAAWSVVWYASYNVLATPTSGELWYNGGQAVLRGYDFQCTNAAGLSFNCWNTVNAGGGVSVGAIPLWTKWWHAYGLTFNPPRTLTVYIDGAVAGSQALTGTQSSVLSTDTMALNGAYPCVVAHLAYYDKLLTAADIAAIHGYRFDWPFGPMVNVTWPAPPSGGASLSPSDPVVVDINADLADIHRAVIHAYPVTPDAGP